MTILTTAHYHATITIGLQKGYTREPIPVDELYNALAVFQKKLISDHDIYLSANCTESTNSSVRSAGAPPEYPVHQLSPVSLGGGYF